MPAKYVKLNINVYEMDNMIGKNVVFANRYVGEIDNMSGSLIEVSLVGEIVNKTFIPGNLSIPPFNSECRLITKEEIDMMYSVQDTSNKISIGKSYIYNDYQVYLSINPFFANHFAIFGNSGSGKSYFVTKLLQGVFYDARKLPYNSNIFLFDAYGEYQTAFSQINRVNPNLNYRVFTTNLEDNRYEKLFIPFWFLSVDDICLLLNVDDSRQIPIIEKALKLVSIFSRSEEETMKKLAEQMFKFVNNIVDEEEKDPKGRKNREMVPQNVIEYIANGMKKGYIEQDGRKYGISRENILKIEEWDFPREMLERTINKIEADGVTFKYQKDAEWEKAGYEDPNAD